MAIETTNLLALMSADQRRDLIAVCSDLDLVQGDKLSDAGDELDRIFFPTTGVISVLATYASGDQIEVATVGREGFVGTTALLGGEVTPATLIVQMPGTAHVMPRPVFQQLISNKPAIATLLQRYADVFLYQVMISAACNGTHAVGQRLARWLLMMLDRADTNTIALTQEFLADILSVRRASVTEALNRFEQDGAISRSRGRIVVADRVRLAALSCDCYGMVDAYRGRAIGHAVSAD